MKYSLVAFAFAVCLVGCSQTSVSDSSDATDNISNDSTEATAQASPVELKLISADQYASELASRKGKVLLIDMWATW